MIETQTIIALIAVIGGIGTPLVIFLDKVSMKYWSEQ